MLVQPDDAMRAIIPSSDHGRDAKRFGHGVPVVNLIRLAGSGESGDDVV
jgi:hypothetical protein